MPKHQIFHTRGKQGKPQLSQECLVPNVWIEFKTFRLRDHHQLPGGRLNKKDGLTRYGDSHVKDKTS